MTVNQGVDHLLRERARAEHEGWDLSRPVAVTHFFSSPGRYPEAVMRSLDSVGINDVVADEELEGDGYWHVAAFTTCLVTETEIGSVERQMDQIAHDADARYDGWIVRPYDGAL